MIFKSKHYCKLKSVTYKYIYLNIFNNNNNKENKQRTKIYQLIPLEEPHLISSAVFENVERHIKNKRHN